MSMSYRIHHECIYECASRYLSNQSNASLVVDVELYSFLLFALLQVVICALFLILGIHKLDIPLMFLIQLYLSEILL